MTVALGYSYEGINKHWNFVLSGALVGVGRVGASFIGFKQSIMVWNIGVCMVLGWLVC